MKRCYRCHQEKPLSEFYKCAAMTDGHFGKCKECYKADVRSNYAAKTGQYKKYYAEREKTAKRKEFRVEQLRRHRANNPQKDRARRILMYAVRTGKIKREPCKCGDSKSQGHHEDYSKPLEVIWLCDKHHKELHRERNQRAG